MKTLPSSLLDRAGRKASLSAVQDPLRADILTNDALRELAASLADTDSSYLDGRSSQALRKRF